MGYLNFCFVFLVILVFPTETFCDLQVVFFCLTLFFVEGRKGWVLGRAGGGRFMSVC